jgi:hypothetical protein
VKHHFIHLSCYSFVHSFDHSFILSWSVLISSYYKFLLYIYIYITWNYKLWINSRNKKHYQLFSASLSPAQCKSQNFLQALFVTRVCVLTLLVKRTLFYFWCEPGWGCQWRDIWISLTRFLWSRQEGEFEADKKSLDLSSLKSLCLWDCHSVGEEGGAFDASNILESSSIKKSPSLWAC